MSGQVAVTLCAITLNGAIVATLDPTLAYLLKAKPFLFDTATIGL
jgi:hypothetical protein